MTVERVCKEFGFGDRPEDVLNIYLTGSRVYGTAEPDADWLVVNEQIFASFLG